jgi:hypothetical protein
MNWRLRFDPSAWSRHFCVAQLLILERGGKTSSSCQQHGGVYARDSLSNLSKKPQPGGYDYWRLHMEIVLYLTLQVRAMVRSGG